MGYRDLGLDAAIRLQLQSIANNYGIHSDNSGGIARIFAELLEKLAAKHGKVVLLIDEYDKPLIDYLDDIPLAKPTNR